MNFEKRRVMNPESPAEAKAEADMEVEAENDSNDSNESNESSDEFDSVVGTRYLAPELSPIWSKENRVLVMRKLWLALVKVQKKMGFIDIPEEGIEEMTQNLEKIDLDKIDEYETNVEYDMIQDMEKFIEEKEMERATEHAHYIERMRKRGIDEEEIEKEIEHEREQTEKRKKEIQEIREMREKDMVDRERELKELREKRIREREEEKERRANNPDAHKDPISFTADGERVPTNPNQETVIRNVTKEVMMNLKAYEDLCPKAKGYIHIAATYSFISENCDLILMKKSLNTLISKLFLFINYMMKRSNEFIDKALLTHTTYGRSHIITLGKRIAMWNTDLMDVFDQWIKLSFPFRGIKGDIEKNSPDRRNSFYENNMQPFKLFDGDVKLCNKLNTELAREFDFSPNKVMIVSGKTQMRAFHIHMIHLLGLLSQAIVKIMNDVQLLISQEEVEEGFKLDKEEESTLFKITPMTTSRVSALSRYISVQEFGVGHTFINHWLDRSLDDTPVNRIVLPEAFLLTEHIIDCSYIIFNKMIFHTDLIDQNVRDFIHHIIREEFILRGEIKGIAPKEIKERLRGVIAEYEKVDKVEREKEKEAREQEDKKLEQMKGDRDRFGRIPLESKSWRAYDIDVKSRQERAKAQFRNDPILYRLLDLPPVGLNLISLNPKDYIGSAPSQVYQLNSFFSGRTSSLFWIK